MGNQNQDQGRQTQSGAGQRTQPQDPKLRPEQDDDNKVERRTSDEGQGRNQSASTRGPSQSGGESESDATSGTAGKSGMSGSGSDRGQSNADRSGNR